MVLSMSLDCEDSADKGKKAQKREMMISSQHGYTRSQGRVVTSFPYKTKGGDG